MAIVFNTDYPSESVPAPTPLQQQKHELAVAIAEVRRMQREAFADFEQLGKQFDTHFSQRLRAEWEGRYWDAATHRDAEHWAERAALDERHRALVIAGDLQWLIYELDAQLRQVTFACISQTGQLPRHLQVV